MLEPGTLFRHYRIVERVGEGGMGVVYRATDTRLERDVALKFLRTHLGDPRLASRLAQEARALAALNHPSIVTIYEIGDADGAPFLALEWIGGGTLRERVLPNPLPVTQFMDYALPIAEALAAAHEQGIVHRDVKPGNVLVTADGRVKLADFGLAKSTDADLDATRTAGLLGTVAYMSPEQANGAAVGLTSDVFSFGVLAYELLTGRLPFAGTGPAAILGAIVAGTHLPISVARPDLPGDLAAVIERSLQKAPDARYQSARELADALRGETAGRSRSQPAGAGPSGQTTAEVDQEIRFTTTNDGYSIAYATAGSGPVLVRVLGHFTHLEVEWQWADMRAFWQTLAGHFTVVRYDGRGMGLSAQYDGAFTEETRQLDLEAVLGAVGAERVTLLGISEGGWTAATYAVRHPDRVSQLVLYGAYCRGARVRPAYDPEEDQALVTLIRKGWGRDTPAFRQVFTSLFFGPDAAPSVISHFNELQRVSATPETAARYYQALHERGDGSEIFRQIRTPTLVMHSRHDLAVSADEGRLLASVIPGAQLALLPSGTHYFPTDAEAVAKAAGTIVKFLRATS